MFLSAVMFKNFLKMKISFIYKSNWKVNTAEM